MKNRIPVILILAATALFCLGAAVKLSQLTTTTTFDDADYFPLIKGGTNRTATAAVLAANLATNKALIKNFAFTSLPTTGTVIGTDLVPLINGASNWTATINTLAANLATNAIIGTNFQPAPRFPQIAGVGGANTNFTLIATNADCYIAGTTNVSIRAVMLTSDTLPAYPSVTITNGSGSDRTIEFSAVTNRYRFAGTYGTNAPTVLTNNTALLLSFQCVGTNTRVSYAYFPWP